MVTTFESVDKILWYDLWEHLNIFVFLLPLVPEVFFFCMCWGASVLANRSLAKVTSGQMVILKRPNQILWHSRYFSLCYKVKFKFFWNCGFVHLRVRSPPLVTNNISLPSLLLSSFWIACSSSMNSITFHYKINE